MVIADRNGNIVYANHVAESILGLNRSEIKTRTYNAPIWKFRTLDGKPFPEKELPFNQIMNSKKPVYGVMIATERPDGKRVILSTNAAPLLDKNGNIESVIASFTDITEQRKAAEEIRESRKQVLDILESITDAFYALDNDWRLTYVNHRAEELFGVRREQLLFRNLWQVINKEQSPQIYEKYHLAKEEVKPVVFEEFSVRLKKWLEMYVYPYENGISVYLRDVTERKQAEDALRRQLRMNLALFNQAVATFALIGLDYRFIQVNKAFAAYYGKKPEDLVGTSIIDYRSAEQSSEDIEEWIDNIVRTKKPTNYINRVYAFWGQPEREIYFDSTSQPIFDEHGEVEFVFFLGVDVTERKKAEDELKKSEQKYRELFEESSNGIFITSPEGKILDNNKKASEIFGYDTKEEVLSLDLARDVYVNPDDKKRVLETVNRQGQSEFDIPVKRKSGEIIIVHISLNATRDESGLITSYRGTVRKVAE